MGYRSGFFFIVKHSQGTCRSGRQMVRGQVNMVNMVDEAKVQSSMNSTIGALIVQHAVQVCPGEAGPL